MTTSTAHPTLPVPVVDYDSGPVRTILTPREHLDAAMAADHLADLHGADAIPVWEAVDYACELCDTDDDASPYVRAVLAVMRARLYH